MLDTLKQEVYEANLSLQAQGLVLLTWGNVSGRDPDTGLVVIKPSGVSYDAMRPENMVVVDPEDGRVVEGDLRPSSDTPTHIVLYKAFSGVYGIAHSHSTMATAWAQSLRPLPCMGTTHSDHFRGEVPVTDIMTTDEIGGAYEEETGNVILRAFEGKEPLEVPGVLVAGHGPFTWGSTPAKAVENSVVLEQVAKLNLLTLLIRSNTSATDLTPLDEVLRDRHFLRKHGSSAYYGQK